MAKYVLSDESLNSYGFRVLTSGINLEGRYLKNPIILYDHNGSILSVGKMKLSVEDDKLIGEPEWDMEDKLGAELARKYEKGFMSGFSIGFEPLQLSDEATMLLPGQSRMTVTKSELVEISATNIPSNKNAVKLSNSENNEIPLITLKDTKMKKILLAFGLAENATEDEILVKLSALQKEQADLTAENTALKSNLNEVKLKLAQKEDAELNAVLDNPQKKLTAAQKENFKKLAKSDRESVIKLVNELPDYQKLSDVPNGDKKEDERMKLSFNELHKKHSAYLQDLKINQPEVYKEKYKEQFGVEPK